MVGGGRRGNEDLLTSLIGFFEKKLNDQLLKRGLKNTCFKFLCLLNFNKNQKFCLILKYLVMLM